MLLKPLILGVSIDFGLLSIALTLRFIRNIYVHGIIDILVLWGNSNNSIGIDDVKRLLGLVQTKSPVELMKLYQIEMDRFH